MDETELKSKLPEPVAQRLQSLRLTDASATLVLDAAGLGRAEAAALEDLARQAVIDAGGPQEVRVALMANKVHRRIIAVASGKGGVGKSTLTTNLAVALARLGHKVGLVDADIYGPSQPRLLANEGQRPEAVDKKLVPVPSQYGVPVLSMGHLAKPGQAIAWRGPMAGNALGQLIDAEWGPVDTLLVDMPPGTGDIQLTMMQKFRPDGVVVVSTPQDLALIDAMRAIDLFGQVDVPIIGLVENMAGYLCPHCGKGSDPFGQGGAEQAAAQKGLPFLGRVPLALEIREASDAGVPPAAGDGPQAESFAAIARRLAQWLAAQGHG
ncbi:Mrp/NBP35 family ATP-binding protein [Caenibius sp. WL]|uniref:Mrp/NBP35 family ATP-binding protein n=1 Tax=Caenibius sp. WL TaxID=2872646 RepID=UPI001C9974B0|nr:Mrp/NBP35 family ATP-binding protein [Caenibius sp. WL]QZP09119.1 Mrp/NBP35 family ATP-binding protein [Caenibius sp. WL]